MKYLLTGDTHGQVMSRIANINQEKYPPGQTALIILGDVGLNFYLNQTDYKNKKAVNNTGYIIYCVRGNHEERPQNISTMGLWFDLELANFVWREPEFPNIRYLQDGEVYLFNGRRTLVIGGAYSIDKWYRLAKSPPNAKWTGWFKDEQLTSEEMNKIFIDRRDTPYDFVFTHTCPISWEPRDLFLNGVDQSTVDKTMENWLEKLKNTISWKAWCFGHFHDDRLVRPTVEMFFTDIDDLDSVYDRWINPKAEYWWMEKDPNYEEEE